MLSIIVEANTGKAEAALKEFQRNLSKADREKAEAELAFQVEKGGYNVFSGLVKKADAMSAKASLEFDVDQASLAKARAGQAILAKESSKLGDVFNRSQLSIGQWGIILAASIPVVFDLAGALGALTASLGAATAGLGALGVGAASAAIVGLAGVASVAVPAIAGLKDLKTAQDAYTEAVERYGKGSSQAETALTKLTFEQQRAGPLVTALADNLSTLTQRWRALTKVGQSDFIGLMNDGVTRLNKKLPLLAESANRSMRALRVGFDTFLKRATGPEFDKFIHVMTVTFAKSVKPLAGAFGNIAKVLQRIAVAVAPDIVRMAKGFEDMTQGWVDSTRNAGRLRETIHGLVNQANAWWKLIKATGELIVAVLVPGMGQGKRAVEGITETLKGWTDWVRSHPEEMKNFFKDGLETTKQLAQALLSFLPTLVELSKAMRPIARAFLVLVKGLNSLKIGSVSALTVLLGAIVATKLAKGVVGMTAAFGRLKSAALGAAAAEKVAMLVPGKKAAIPAATTVAQAPHGAPIPPMLATPKGMNVASMAKYAKVAGGVAVAVTAVAGAFMALRDNFLGVRDVFTGFFEKVLKPLGDAFTDLIDELSGGHAAQIFGAIGVALGTIAKPLKFVVTNLTKLVGLLAIGAISAPFVAAMTAIAAPIWVAIKAITLLVRGIKHLGRMVADVAKFIIGAWIRPSVLIAPFRVGVRKALDIFEPMKGKVADISRKIGHSLRDIFGSAWGAVKDIFQKGAQAIGGIFGRVGKRIGNIAKGIRSVFTGLAKVIHKVADFIVHAVDRMVGALGSIKDKIGNVVPSLPSLPSIPNPTDVFKQRGGPIGGTGEGDKVRALLEPGEFVVNKKATKAARPALEKLNREVPRFQTGGMVDRTGVQHFAKGGMAAMIAEANKFERRGFPYTWGGGHSDFGIQPVDCSGAVSQVLHAAGLLKAPMVSGDLAHWGKAGKGPLTVYANPAHTFMSLAGKFFGTSASNPAGGAGWFSRPDRGYLSGFAARTMDVMGGVMGKIKRIRIDGKGPIKDIAQGSADTMRKAANQYIAKQMPGGRFGGGQTLKDFSKGPGKIVGASVYGFGEAGTGTVGASGVSLPGKPAFAELDMGTALGHLPFGKKVGIEVGGKKAVGIKLDIGAGGGAVGGHHRAIDFWRDLAEKLGLSGSFLGLAKVRGLQKGGVVDRTGVQHQAIAAPFVGSFDKGGEVAKTGLGLLHEGERVVPKMAQGGFVAGGGGAGGGGLGVERIQRIRERLGKQLNQVVPRLDEEIDIASQLAGLTSSPGGSELAKSEVQEQMKLQQRLLRTLRNTLGIAKRGMRMVQRVMKQIEDGIKKLQRKIEAEQKQMERQVKRLTQFIESERKKDKPDQKAIEKAQGKLRDVKARHARPLERWQEQLGKYNKAAPRLPEMRQGFREAIVELSGLTGRGGRIFDTSLAVKELRAQGKPQAIGIEELLSFAEAMRFGAFNRQLSSAGNLPTFAKGGVVPGRSGEPVPVIAHGGERFLGIGSTAPATVINITFAEGMGWLKEFIHVEADGRIEVRERRKTDRYRAGVK